MWFEGRVELRDFPAKIAELMQTIPTGQSKPMWERIPSNIGSTLTDDGHILYSKGSTGKDNLYISIKEAYPNNDWALGPAIYIAESFTSGEEGKNGVIGPHFGFAHRLHYTTNWNGTSLSTFMVNYKMSVTKDRVVLVTENGVTMGNATVPVYTMSYFGLMKRYSEEIDSSAMIVGSNHSYYMPSTSNEWSSVRSLRNRQGVLGGGYNTRFTHIFNTQGIPTVGDKPLVTSVPLYNETEGYRGELDGVLVSRMYNNASIRWRSMPLNQSVKVNGKEYLTIQTPYYNLNRHNNFEETTEAYVFLIEKR